MMPEIMFVKSSPKNTVKPMSKKNFTGSHCVIELPITPDVTRVIMQVISELHTSDSSLISG